MTEAVANAGPLIHLDEVGAGQALAIFDHVIVPRPIAAEIQVRPEGPGTVVLHRNLVAVQRPTAQDMQQVATLTAFQRLSPADRIALAMAAQRAYPLLTDDLDLRDAAHALQVQPVGTIGILLRAVTREFIAEPVALAALDALLHQSSLFITPALVERAKDALRSM